MYSSEIYPCCGFITWGVGGVGGEVGGGEPDLDQLCIAHQRKSDARLSWHAAEHFFSCLHFSVPGN